jgi:hypothetical protein
VCEALRSHPTAAHALDPIVTNRRGSFERLADVVTFEESAPGRRVRPDTGVTVGLQFHAHRQLVRPRRIATLRLSHLRVGSRERLHMMSDLMREDVGLREVPWCAKALLQLAVEAEVDVDPLVGRAIERTGGRLREATSGLHCVGEQDQAGAPVAGAEQSGPDVLAVVQNERDEFDELFFFGRGCEGLRRRRVEPGAAPWIGEREEVLAGEERENEQQDQPAHANRQCPSYSAALAPAVLEILTPAS